MSNENRIFGPMGIGVDAQSEAAIGQYLDLVPDSEMDEDTGDFSYTILPNDDSDFVTSALGSDFTDAVKKYNSKARAPRSERKALLELATMNDELEEKVAKVDETVAWLIQQYRSRLGLVLKNRHDKAFEVVKLFSADDADDSVMDGVINDIDDEPTRNAAKRSRAIFAELERVEAERAELNRKRVKIISRVLKVASKQENQYYEALVEEATAKIDGAERIASATSDPVPTKEEIEHFNKIADSMVTSKDMETFERNHGLDVEDDEEDIPESFGEYTQLPTVDPAAELFQTSDEDPAVEAERVEPLQFNPFVSLDEETHQAAASQLDTAPIDIPILDKVPAVEPQNTEFVLPETEPVFEQLNTGEIEVAESAEATEQAAASIEVSLDPEADHSDMLGDPQLQWVESPEAIDQPVECIEAEPAFELVEEPVEVGPEFTVEAELKTAKAVRSAENEGFAVPGTELAAGSPAVDFDDSQDLSQDVIGDEVEHQEDVHLTGFVPAHEEIAESPAEPEGIVPIALDEGVYFLIEDGERISLTPTFDALAEKYNIDFD